MSSREQPLIAVNGLLTVERERGLALAVRYAEAILAAGGLPVAIPPAGGPRDLERLLGRVDGLLLTGGDDFTTERLGLGPTHPAAAPVPVEKQDFDVLLARTALELGLPVLGICYGMQLLGLIDGAALLQHLPEDRPGRGEHGANTIHPVRIEPGTKLAQVLGVGSLDVISRHHQALADAPAPWRVCARDPEGLIEAIEREEHPFAIGVQWHPELSSEGSPDQRLFRGLVAAASLRVARGPAPLSTRP